MRVLTALFGVLLVPTALAVKTHDFKVCSQAGFCRRGRALATRASENAATWKSPYSVDKASISVDSVGSTLVAGVKSSLYPDVKFSLEVRLHEDGVARVRMDETGGLLKRYDEAASWALISEPKLSKTMQWKVGKKDARITWADNELVITFEPLRVTMNKSGKEQVVLNGRGLLHMEHFRKKAEEPAAVTEGEQAEGEQARLALEEEQKLAQLYRSADRAWFEGDSEDGYWEETFGSWTDTKPKGALNFSPLIH